MSDMSQQEVLQQLAEVLESRKGASPDSSYVAGLYDKGLDAILKKIGEEATETVMAAKDGDAEKIVYEVRTGGEGTEERVMSDCLFCKIAAGEIPADIVFEDEQVVVFRDIYPKADVHLLLIPRQHIASLDELEPAHDALIAHMMRLLPKLAHLLGGGRLPGFA